MDIDAVNKELEELRTMLIPYKADDIYNMDETALYWKTIPDWTLANEPRSGGKKIKNRITVNLCCNATGTHKLDIWFIGTSKKPRCFSSSRVNINNLNMEWRYNKTAWMTAIIFRDYLHWFDSQMDHPVVLLVDGFSAHELGLTLIEEGGGLHHTRVIFLPPNATSVCQPLDQGIIRTWKAYYRKSWLNYIVSEYENDRDPQSTMHVLNAIRWGITAWEQDILSETITNCWIHSTMLGVKMGPFTSNNNAKRQHNQLYKELERRIKALKDAGKIRETININNFINPPDKIVKDEDSDILK